MPYLNFIFLRKIIITYFINCNARFRHQGNYVTSPYTWKPNILLRGRDPQYRGFRNYLPNTYVSNTYSHAGKDRDEDVAILGEFFDAVFSGKGAIHPSDLIGSDKVTLNRFCSTPLPVDRNILLWLTLQEATYSNTLVIVNQLGYKAINKRQEAYFVWVQMRSRSASTEQSNLDPLYRARLRKRLVVPMQHTYTTFKSVYLYF